MEWISEVASKGVESFQNYRMYHNSTLSLMYWDDMGTTVPLAWIKVNKCEQAFNHRDQQEKMATKIYTHEKPS